GIVNVSAGAVLNAGGVNDLQALTLNGGATANLISPVSHTGTAVLVYGSGSAGAANTLNLGANNTLNAQRLSVDEGTIFNKNGAGTLRVAAAHQFGNDSEVHVNAGKLILNSTGLDGTGSVFVSGGATLGGGGSILGSVSVASGGHIAPGDGGVGTLTAGGMSLTSSL